MERKQSSACQGVGGGIMGSDCSKGIQCVLGVMCFRVMVTQHCEY